MVLDNNQYRQIYQELCTINCIGTLAQLKQHFQEDVNSKRRLEEIKSLPDLLKILEKRDVISPQNVAPFQYIVDMVAPHRVDIQNALQGNASVLYQNFGVNQSNQNQRVIPPVDPDPIKRIHNMIKTDIGIKWKELARALSIPEGTIDTLAYRHRGNIPEMVEEILQSHRENFYNNHELWRYKLQEALRDARRQDLSLRMNEILSFLPAHNVA